MLFWVRNLFRISSHVIHVSLSRPATSPLKLESKPLFIFLTPPVRIPEPYSKESTANAYRKKQHEYLFPDHPEPDALHEEPAKTAPKLPIPDSPRG